MLFLEASVKSEFGRSSFYQRTQVLFAQEDQDDYYQMICPVAQSQNYHPAEGSVSGFGEQKKEATMPESNGSPSGVADWALENMRAKYEEAKNRSITVSCVKSRLLKRKMSR
jgi:hypothetical protein